MTRNAYGMVLAGGIPTQPLVSGFTTGNEWTTGGWGHPYYQTWVAGSTFASMGVMKVNTGISTQIPSVNYSDVWGHAYPTGSSIILTSDPNLACVYPVASTVSKVTTSGITIIDFLISIARQQVFDPGDPKFDAKTWIAQNQLFEMINHDTSVIDTSVVLDSFYSRAIGSRYKWLANLNDNVLSGNFSAADSIITFPVDTLANSDTDSVSGMRMADGSTAGTDNIVGNYKEYYRLLVQYLRDTLDSTDSVNLAVLAFKCPTVDGPIIYQARSLYSVVFEDFPPFNDAGCDGDTTTTTPKPLAKERKTDHQSYTLYPNPTDGHINLHQAVADSEPVSIEVWNATGAKVFRNKVAFQGGDAYLQLSKMPPGLYLLQVLDARGNRFVIKFTIQ